MGVKEFKIWQIKSLRLQYLQYSRVLRENNNNIGIMLENLKILMDVFRASQLSLSSFYDCNSSKRILMLIQNSRQLYNIILEDISSL